jgi:preprotein translocase subunit SecG
VRLLAVLSKNAELLSSPTQRKIFQMLGFFLFSLFFTLLCLLVYLPTRKTKTPWWVKIDTQMPRCTYYFGPFDNLKEAQQTQPGFVEDLEKEGATGIMVLVSQCDPQTLTICEEDE